MSADIVEITALQVLDSRGNPTVEAEVRLSNGVTARAQTPSGASAGRHEAIELRDGPQGAYGGRSVLRAVANIEEIIAPRLEGFTADRQRQLDELLIELDGTPDKRRLGANAILAVSMAAARAAAASRGLALWEYLCGEREALLPVPMINIISGGLHAGRRIEFQDFLIVPHGFDSLAEALEAAVRIHRETGRLLEEDGYTLTGVADEGGWGPALEKHEAALEYLMCAIEAAGLKPAEQVSIALDVAASHFHKDASYHLASEGLRLTADGMVDLLEGWAGRYPILSIEDGLEEDDWEGWRRMTGRLGKRCTLVGDDFFVTNAERLERGVSLGAGNAVLVKMNQAGTLTETFQVIDRAREAGFEAVISARSGETEDDFLADLAIASGAGQIKVGSVTRSERLAKYNRLLWVEDRLRRTGEGPLPFSEARRRLFSRREAAARPGR